MNLSSVRVGIQNADRMLNDAATKITKGGGDVGVEPMVELRVAQAQQSATRSFAETVWETLGTLVNLHV